MEYNTLNSKSDGWFCPLRVKAATDAVKNYELQRDLHNRIYGLRE